MLTPDLLNRLGGIPPHLFSSPSQHPEQQHSYLQEGHFRGRMSSKATVSPSVSALFEDTLLIIGDHDLLNYSFQFQSLSFPWGSILVFTRLVRFSSRAVSTVWTWKVLGGFSLRYGLEILCRKMGIEIKCFISTICSWVKEVSFIFSDTVLHIL